MTEQPTLFAGQSRRTDPRTSRDASARITGRTERLILEVMPNGNGWIADELVLWFEDRIYGPTVVSALSRLNKRGLVVATGDTRPSRRGSEQTVWRLASRRSVLQETKGATR